MSPANGKPNFQSDSYQQPTANDSTGLILSLATAPFLVACLTAEKMAELLLVTGQASEEIFRGDRLPVLNFPNHIQNRDR